LIGVDTQIDGSNAVSRSLYLCAAAQYCSFDDLYLLDTSTPGHNDFLGPIHIKSLHPNGDTTTADMTPSTGVDHYALVDDTNPDIAEYLTADAVNETDIWDYEDVPSDSQVKAIQINTSAYTDGTLEHFSPIVRSGGTNYEQTQVPVFDQVLDYRFELLETNPDTSSAWTPSTLNAAQFGVKRK
jgi:hypothetical protein